MLIFKLAMRNLARHPRKTMLLATLIATGMAALFVSNAVFESTNTGLRASFVGSLTGDASIRARTETTFGLFGSEIPIVSEYETIPPIPSFGDVADMLDRLDSVAEWTPVVSTPAQIRAGGYTGNSLAFGVDPSSYFSVLSDIVIEKGDPADLSRGGVFINTTMLAAMEAVSQRKLVLGELVILGMYSGSSFNLKRGFFAGVHRYVGSTEALEHVVIADATLVRSVANYTLGYASGDSDSTAAPSDSPFELDSLFDEPEDTESNTDSGLTLDSVVASMADTTERDALVITDSAAWSFALIKAKEGHGRQLVSDLDESIQARALECRAMDWRTAAGMSAQALFAVQTAFYVGLGFVALGAVLVIMNALVISVLERSAEIGTMRGLGAGASFIRRLFIAESMLLTTVAAVLGVSAGALAAALLARTGISVTNPLLVTLFGGDVIRPIVSARSILLHLLLASLVGASAWVYPVSLAMKVQPIAAMNGS